MTISTRWLAASSLAVAVLAGACGDTGTTTPDAQPVPDAPVFRGGHFDGLPRYPRSLELGPALDTAGVVAQSFRVRGTTPENIVGYYTRELFGDWQPLSEVEVMGEDALRARWARGDSHLQVTAALAPTLEDEGGPAAERPVVQYSLQLGPPEAFP